MPNDPATSGGMEPNGGSGAPTPIAPLAAPKDAGLGRELGGDLPCVVCGYNLRGLSIRSMCPECGTNVRATILSLVDPYASELRPITFPRLTAAGMILWAFGAVAVALMSWLPQGADILHQLGARVNRPSAGLGVMFGLGTSALGSLALIRPHAGIARAHSIMAALATAMYVPLGWALWRYHMEVDRAGGQHYLSRWAPSADMSLYLASAGAMIATLIMLQRPNARLFVARSMVLRTGRVDRQTMYAMAIAACVIAIGALLGRVPGAPGGEVARMVGVVMVAFGGLLLSIGALGSLLDAARIAGAILIPKMTVRQVIREGRPSPRSGFMKMIDPNVPVTDTGPRPISGTGTTLPPPTTPPTPPTHTPPTPGAGGAA